MIKTQFVLAAMSIAALNSGCNKLKDHAPGGGGGGIPTVPTVPGGASGEVDPNTCGNYAASDTGAKLKAFLEATKELEATTVETVKVVKESCVIMGKELGMSDADFAMETQPLCDKVFATLQDNWKVAFKAKAGLKIKYTPAVCKVDIKAEAEVAAKCEGHASADVGASCSGVCHGKCDGQCSGKAGTGGNSGECSGQCSGSCHGSCEGHADVKASAECKAKANASVNASMQCTQPELVVEADAKLTVDPSKAKMVVAALKNGLPKILSVKARLEPLKYAVEVWAGSAKELAEMGPKITQSFKDQALCISGQIGAALNMVPKINANVSVSVSVSASASGSVGG